MRERRLIHSKPSLGGVLSISGPGKQKGFG